MSFLPLEGASASLEHAAPPLPPRRGRSSHSFKLGDEDSYSIENPTAHTAIPASSLGHKQSFSSLLRSHSSQSQFLPTPQLSPTSLTSPVTQHDMKSQSILTSDCYASGSVSPPVRPYSAPTDDSVPVVMPENTVRRQPVEVEASNWGMRFLGNTLNGRIIRAGTRSVVSTAISPIYLSPWGDNNPITLPNVRKRDFGYAALGDLAYQDIFESSIEVLDYGSDQISKFLIGETVGNAAEETVDRLKPTRPLKVVRTAHLKSVEVRIKHKLIGKSAEIKFFGEYPARHRMASDKGWFCPYLYSSGRTPLIARAHDFIVAGFFGPALQADLAVAPTLVRIMEESDTPIIRLCDSGLTHYFGCSRLLLLCLGISPWRTQAWSQARNPGEARLMFHLLNSTQALVLPVVEEAPTCAWSPRTLHQMHEEKFEHGRQVEDLYNYLGSIISSKDITESLKGDHRDMLRQGLNSIMQGVVNTKSNAKSISKMVDLKRMGIVMSKF